MVAIAAGFLYASPYLAVHSMMAASRDGDLQRLSEYIDVPAVRESIKFAMARRLPATLGTDKSSNPLAAIGNAIGAAFLDSVIDATVTPESIALMLEGKPPALAGAPAATDDASKAASPAKPADPQAFYEDANHFVIEVARAGQDARPMRFVLARSGLWGWKLTSVRFPDS